MRPQPIAFKWCEVALPEGMGELTLAMVPLQRYRNVANRQFGEPGSEHVLEQTSERSMASHNQYFAALHDAWVNLPDREAAKYPSAEHLRKRLLVAAGYSEDRHLLFKDRAQAVEAASILREMDAFVVLSVADNELLVRRAKSQSMKAMGKADFEASKKAVLDLAEHLTGVPARQAMKEAGRSA